MPEKIIISEPFVKSFLQKYTGKTREKYKLYLTAKKFREYFDKSASEIHAEYDKLESAKDLMELARKYGEIIQGLHMNNRIPIIGAVALKSWFKSKTIPTGRARGCHSS